MRTIWLVLLAIPSIRSGFGNLWCHQGDGSDYSPAECSPQTVECFRFSCDGVEEPFIARGCGVSVLTTAAGLPNESCHQAQAACETIGGHSTCLICNNRHLCNSMSISLAFLPIIVSFTFHII